MTSVVGRQASIFLALCDAQNVPRVADRRGATSKAFAPGTTAQPTGARGDQQAQIDHTMMSATRFRVLKLMEIVIICRLIRDGAAQNVHVSWSGTHPIHRDTSHHGTEDGIVL
eukprot:m.104845 g.104845  ORF g.104845 m.104845 type:complete len:113 (+) comp12619_c0_seq4:277-615(+)